ncbi:MAG: phosphonate ABC transporter, permease protein PhnE [Sulfitobacter sp.]
MTAIDMGQMHHDAVGLFKRKRRAGFAVPAIILVYFVYIFFAFDLAGLADRARMDNAVTLASDSWSYKTHVTRDNRNGEISYAIEGERKGTYPEGERPEWVSGDVKEPVVDLDGGYIVRFLPDNAVAFDIPDFGTLEAQVVDGRVVTNLGKDAPDFINVSGTRLTVTTEEGRLTMTRSRTEVFEYTKGWELFWFTLDSPYHDQGLVPLFGGVQLDPGRSNISGMWQDFWGNKMWRHSDVFFAIGETILMAFLGTFGAAMIALPLAFLAARNFAPLGAARFVVRRVFDFVRGVDGLIWTIVLSRAFGPGPMTGALAILITDTGSFGKIFSEALENVDEKQIEGVASTGAKPLQRYRFGVIPQITPVLLSQVLYYMESNTRSATIIGAITGGGIGLLLTQAMQTQKDWEEVSYYIVLIILMVMLMDTFSGWLRRKLITGDEGGH